MSARQSSGKSRARPTDKKVRTPLGERVVHVDKSGTLYVKQRGKLVTLRAAGTSTPAQTGGLPVPTWLRRCTGCKSGSVVHPQPPRVIDPPQPRHDILVLITSYGNTVSLKIADKIENTVSLNIVDKIKVVTVYCLYKNEELHGDYDVSRNSAQVKEAKDKTDIMQTLAEYLHIWMNPRIEPTTGVSINVMIDVGIGKNQVRVWLRKLTTKYTYIALARNAIRRDDIPLIVKGSVINAGTVIRTAVVRKQHITHDQQHFFEKDLSSGLRVLDLFARAHINDVFGHQSRRSTHPTAQSS
jgi:hypothetical protein